MDNNHFGFDKNAKYSNVKKEFNEPPKIFSPYAFWFWTDDKINKETIIYQTNEMNKKSMSAGYIQSRNACDKNFLSDAWFSTIDKVVEQSKNNNMPFGYCDEIGAPCGIVGGKLLLEHPEFAAVSLKWDIVIVAKNCDVQLSDCFFKVGAQIKGNEIYSDTLEIIETNHYFNDSDNEMKIYCFTKYTGKSAAGSFVNYLDKNLPEVLIDMVHSKYNDRYKDDLGKTISSVFLDMEGDYGYKLAWSDDLDNDYKVKKGRDIRLWMPLLFEKDVEGKWGKARWDWYDVVSDIYSQSFIGKISDWYAKRGVSVCCHTWENSLFEQAVLVGDFFKASRAVSIPGTDSLGLSAIDCPRTFKETQSIAEFESRRNMCEILGCSGWKLSPNNMKKSANAAISLGVNHFVLHGVYTDRNFPEAGFPPDFFEWNPYWEYFDKYADFIRRASFINGKGYVKADTLLLYPMDSIWALTGDSAFDVDIAWNVYINEDSCLKDMEHKAQIGIIEKCYTDTINKLTEERIEYFICDNYYIKQMELGLDGSLKRQELSFENIIIPHCVMMSIEVVNKIIDFAQSGGNVYYIGDLPNASIENGMNDPIMIDLSQKLKRLSKFLDIKGDIKLQSQINFEKGHFPMQQLHRVIDGNDFYWLSNNNDDNKQATLMVNNSFGKASIWNCETGEIKEVSSVETDYGSIVELGFDPYEAFWLSFNKAEKPVKGNKKAADYTDILILDGLWNLKIDVEDQPIQAQHKLVVPLKLLSKKGIHSELKSWLCLGLDSFSGFVNYEKTFEMVDVNGEFLLDLGKVKYMAEVWLNDENIGSNLWGLFQFDISGILCVGTNKLKIKIGNTLANASKLYEERTHFWRHGGEPTEDEYDAGLFGTVKIKKISIK